LYHGTPAVDYSLMILRSEMYVSTGESGSGTTAVMGRGDYTSNERATSAGYAGSEGVVIPLDVRHDSRLNILDWNTAQRDPFIQDVVAKAAAAGKDPFEVLARQHGIDIIINDHVLIQNIGAIEIPTTLKPVMDAFYSTATNPESSLEGRMKAFAEYSRLYDFSLASGDIPATELSPKAFFEQINFSKMSTREIAEQVSNISDHHDSVLREMMKDSPEQSKIVLNALREGFESGTSADRSVQQRAEAFVEFTRFFDLANATGRVAEMAVTPEKFFSSVFKDQSVSEATEGLVRASLHSSQLEKQFYGYLDSHPELKAEVLDSLALSNKSEVINGFRWDIGNPAERQSLKAVFEHFSVSSDQQRDQESLFQLKVQHFLSLDKPVLFQDLTPDMLKSPALVAEFQTLTAQKALVERELQPLARALTEQSPLGFSALVPLDSALQPFLQIYTHAKEGRIEIVPIDHRTTEQMKSEFEPILQKLRGENIAPLTAEESRFFLSNIERGSQAALIAGLNASPETRTLVRNAILAEPPTRALGEFLSLQSHFSPEIKSLANELLANPKFRTSLKTVILEHGDRGPINNFP
jgi:hypothetical protein